MRDALTVLGTTLLEWRGAAGRRDQVDPVRHLIVTATGWGLNPDKDAMYLNVVPSKNDGTTIYKLRVKDVPVDGFWSVSVYNAEGYFVKNASDAYTFNNITAKKDADGSVTIQFGGCDGKVPNCLPIMPGWNYTVRLYRPRAEILDGSWKVPQAQPSGESQQQLRKPNVTVAIRRFHQLLSMAPARKKTTARWRFTSRRTNRRKTGSPLAARSGGSVQRHDAFL